MASARASNAAVETSATASRLSKNVSVFLLRWVAPSCALYYLPG